ncbi:zf-TFIIB domain-containing protein [Acidobacteriota bacterium]
MMPKARVKELLQKEALKIKKLKQTLVETRRKMEKDLVSLKSENRTILNKLKAFASAVDQIKKEKKLLDHQLTQKLTDHMALNKTIERKNAEIFKKERQIESLYHENQSKLRQLMEKEESIQQCNAKIRQKETRIDELHGTIATFEREKSEQEGAMVMLDRQFMRKRKELDEFQLIQQQEQGEKAYWMICPKCGGSLKECRYRLVKFLACAICEGIYIDKGEIEIASAYGEESRFFTKLKSFLK